MNPSPPTNLVKNTLLCSNSSYNFWSKFVIGEIVIGDKYSEMYKFLKIVGALTCNNKRMTKK